MKVLFHTRARMLTVVNALVSWRGHSIQMQWDVPVAQFCRKEQRLPC